MQNSHDPLRELAKMTATLPPLVHCLESAGIEQTNDAWFDYPGCQIPGFAPAA